MRRISGRRILFLQEQIKGIIIIGRSRHVHRACKAVPCHVYSTCFCMKGIVSNIIETIVTYVPIFAVMILVYPELNARLLYLL